MTGNRHHWWAGTLARWAVRRTGLTLTVIGLLTAAAGVVASGLQLRMSWTELLPSGDPTVVLYRDVLERFGEASIVVALEGERDAIVAMAEDLEPRLSQLASLHTVVGRMPTDFMLDHGFALTKPERFDRTLESFDDWTLPGVFRGLNDDFEREYVESESNLRRDEVEIGRGLLGMTRSLELLSDGIAGEVGPDAMAEAADALVVGDPWWLSLDRRMLLIALTPRATTDEIDRMLATVDEVEAVIAEVGVDHPAVYASTTGMGKISQDEMNSVGGYTVLLSLIALVLIYLLLSQAFRGWVMPLLALAPLVIGIVWTMGLLELLFDSLNLFTAMMMLVLLGLGIDFSIHLISRFSEEVRHDDDLERAIGTMFRTTGVAVTMGAVTTALAFLTLMVGETQGVFEFGVAAGLGVLLALLAIFTTLPHLLVLRHRARHARGGHAHALLHRAAGYQWIGSVAAASWRRPGVFVLLRLAA